MRQSTAANNNKYRTGLVLASKHTTAVCGILENHSTMAVYSWFLAITVANRNIYSVIQIYSFIDMRSNGQKLMVLCKLSQNVCKTAQFPHDADLQYSLFSHECILQEERLEASIAARRQEWRNTDGFVVWNLWQDFTWSRRRMSCHGPQRWCVARTRSWHVCISCKQYANRPVNQPLTIIHGYYSTKCGPQIIRIKNLSKPRCIISRDSHWWQMLIGFLEDNFSLKSKESQAFCGQAPQLSYNLYV